MFQQRVLSSMTTNDDARGSMTRGERIRAAARTLRTPQTASWVADETEVSVKTAQKYLEQLVEDDILRRIEQGGQTRYCVDQLMATYREVATLQREHDREALTDALESMRSNLTSSRA
jgi:predicted HTH transcriptional regulator